MKVFNLTDKARHGKDPSPQVIRIEGVEIRPGGKAELPKVNLARVSGMIYSGKIAIDELPAWYIKARRQGRRPVPKESFVEAPKERWKTAVADSWLEEKDETE